MADSPHTHSHAHSHADGCGCQHDHDHAHSHDHAFLSLTQRWMLTVLIVVALCVFLRPFIISQMLVRVTSYAASNFYEDAIRLCDKVIAIDRKNVQAWTSLGYVYMDLSQTDRAIAAFDKVLFLKPDDKAVASFELGRAYYAKGDYSRAITYFERVRTAGPKAAALLDADILKYRHGTRGFSSVNSMQTLLGLLAESYKKTGDTAKAAAVQAEYEAFKTKHSKVLF